MTEFNYDAEYVDYLEDKFSKGEGLDGPWGIPQKKLTIREFLGNLDDDPCTDHYKVLFADKLDDICTEAKQYTCREMIDAVRAGKPNGIIFYDMLHGFHPGVPSEVEAFEKFKKRK